jgi:hypothetical protein
MGEIVIAPEGASAIDAGYLIDDDGARFVAVSFNRPGQDRVIVTFTVPLFEAFSAHLANVAEGARDEENWRNHPR